MTLMIPLLLRILSFLLFSVSQIAAQNGPTAWTVSPFNAPAFPLAVRSPYLNTWLNQGNNPQAANNIWSNLWSGTITGWYASVVVDGIAYRILGAAVIANVSTANQTAAEFTPTRTSFLFTAGSMQINASFLSPIEPTDLLRQSLPFTYLYMSATSTDGKAHSLRMYSDISGEFIAGDTTQIAQWTPDDSGQYTVLRMSLQSQQKYAEILNHAQDATEYYSFKKISGTTASWAISQDIATRLNAANASLPLSNAADPTPRAVSNQWPVLGIAVDWGEITSTPQPAVWALGVVRNPVVQYRRTDGTLQERQPYFVATYGDVESAVEFFLDDFNAALAAAQVFDAQLLAAGTAFSSDYADMLALSARQAFGALDITLAVGASGAWNFSDVKAFMKNMGGVGSDLGAQTSVNTVDTLYAAFPVFMYLNPELGGYLLAPLLEYQDSIAYTLGYAARNIGSAYPNATADGINNAHDYGVEESANMLIMTLAYSQTSGNGTFISKHYTLLQTWADYLGNNSLTPINQKSADFTTTSVNSNNNQTNTALKGIIGIASMAQIAKIAGVSSDQERYNNTATSFIQQWQSEALASDDSHIDFFYGQTSTNGLMYNLYADKLLQLGLVSDTVYQVLSEYYDTIAGQTKFGLPLDNNDPRISKTNWMMFAASTVSDTATRNDMVSQLHGYASANLNNTPFGSTYDPTTGISLSDANSPVQGSIFSLLALNTTIRSISIPSSGTTIPGGVPSGRKSSAGAIAGGVVAAVVVTSALGAGLFFFLRRRRAQHKYSASVEPIVMASTHHGKPPGLAPGTTFEPFVYSDVPDDTATMPKSSQGVPSTTLGYTPTGSADPLSPARDSSARARAGGGVPDAPRDSAYFRTHRPGESSSDIGPSASQVGSGTTSSGSGRGSGRGSGSGSGSGSGRGSRARGGSSGRRGGSGSDGTHSQVVMAAKQTLVNEELRSEVDNLRRDLERIRRERVVEEEAPPSYFDPQV